MFGNLSALSTYPSHLTPFFHLPLGNMLSSIILPFLSAIPQNTYIEQIGIFPCDITTL